MDSTHLHLALNHFPVLGTPFLLGLLIWSWVRRQEATLRLSLWMFLALFVVSLVVKFTGEFAVESHGMDPTFEDARIRLHEQSADQATTGVFLVGVAAALALFLSRAGRAMPEWSVRLLALLALATVALMLRCANLGGQIRHPEIRPNAALSAPVSP